MTKVRGSRKKAGEGVYGIVSKRYEHCCASTGIVVGWDEAEIRSFAHKRLMTGTHHHFLATIK